MAGLVEVVDREEPSTVRFGEDVLLRRRWCRPNTSPTARVGSGTPIEQADVTQITYTLCRLKNGTWTIVEDHNAVVLVVADVLFDALQPWGSDTLGFNFQHVIEETSLAPIAEYRAIYDVTLGDGFSKQFTKDFAVIHEFDAGEVPGESTVFLTGSPGINGADGDPGPGYAAASTTSVAIGTGIKTFITQTGLAYSAGARTRATNTGDTGKWVEGVVFTYTANILVLSVDLTSGTGTYASWNINLAGEPGAAGVASPGASLIFSQTETVVVANNAAATTLIGGGEGSNIVAANSPAVGDEYTFEASGYYSTKAVPSGDAVMTFNIGAELTLTFPTIQLLGSRTNARWKMRGSLTYRTIGASATVVANADLEVQDATPAGADSFDVGTTTAVTVPSDSSKVPNLKIDWETADASNSWSCQKFSIRKAGVSA